MKVAYFSTPWFADIDLCYLSEAQKISVIDYYMVLHRNSKATAINFDPLPNRNAIINAREYPALAKFSQIINLDNFWILNIDSSHSLSFKSIKVFWSFFLRLIHNKYDVIHFTRPFSILVPFVYFLRKKMVFTIHDPIEHSGHVNKRHLIEKRMAISNVSHYILLNDVQEKDFIKRFNINTSRKHIYISSLSCYSYLKMYKPKKLVNNRYVLFFGSINPYKGLDILFPAMERVLAVYKDVRLVVAGKGSFNFDIAKYISNSSYEIINKFIPDEELASLIDGSAFVVAPYHDATQSGVVMSAFAFNKPCVVTNVGALPDMVINDVFGKVVEPNNIEELSKAIIELLAAPQALSKFSNNIESQYKEGELSWKHIAEGIAEIYKGIPIF